MHAVAEQADLVVNMANHGTALTAFVAGIPQILIPRRQEQNFLAWRLEQQGVGVAIAPKARDVTDAVRRAVELARQGRQAQPAGFFEEFTGQRLERAIDAAMEAAYHSW